MNICHEITAFGQHDHLSEPLFIRLDVLQEYPLDAMPKPQQIMPMLYLPAGSQADTVNSHIEFAKRLKDHGIKRCVIAADEDGALHRSLSPRFNQEPLDVRMRLLAEIFSRLQSVMEEVWVLLVVEELAPGGIDATDGIAMANFLAKLGLKTIIATAGTKDFMPLYDRRMTQKKPCSKKDFYSNEPSLASSLWLLHHTDLTVWCLAFLDDDDEALKLARTIGLTGLIKKERYAQI